MGNLSKGCIYYTSNRLRPSILLACQEQLRKAFKGEIVSCALQPIDFGDKRIVLDKEPGYLTMFEQILACLEASTADVVYFTEHDCLYDESNFTFTPPDRKYYYNLNWWKIGNRDLAVHWDAAQVSGLCCYRDLAIDFYKQRIAEFNSEDFDRKFEPATGQEGLLETWWSYKPMIDIRHGENTTFNKWKMEHFRKKDTAVNFQSATIADIPGWSTIQLESLINKE